MADVELTQYSWWGQPNAPPENLRTKKQLGELGLSPVKPVGVIKTIKYNCYLYDPKDSASVRPKRKCSPAQLKALERQRNLRHYQSLYDEYWENIGQFHGDRINAVKWAQECLAANKSLILDTETTGLGDYAQIIEIGVINLEGDILIESLCQPVGPWEMDIDAIAVHGIHPSDLINAPLFSELYPKLASVLQDQHVLIYNSSFDLAKLSYAYQLSKTDPIQFEAECLMDWHAQWVNEWSNYFHNYRWQPLCGNHRAIGDCKAALSKLKLMAESSTQIAYPDWLMEAAKVAEVELPTHHD